MCPYVLGGKFGKCCHQVPCSDLFFPSLYSEIHFSACMYPFLTFRLTKWVIIPLTQLLWNCAMNRYKVQSLILAHYVLTAAKLPAALWTCSLIVLMCFKWKTPQARRWPAEVPVISSGQTNIAVQASTTVLMSAILRDGLSTLHPTSRTAVLMPTAMLTMTGPAPTSALRTTRDTRLSSIRDRNTFCSLDDYIPTLNINKWKLSCGLTAPL
jgi:hypothetical protein